MSDEEKRAIAMATLFGLGIGAAYLLKDDLKDELKEPQREEKEEIPQAPPENPKQIISDVEKEERTNVDVIPGEEVHGLTWDYFRRWLGNYVPRMDMLYIYPLLSEDFKNKWRIGIYNYGVSTAPDRFFVYYDSYYLGQNGYPMLDLEFKKYVSKHGSFESLFREYQKTIKMMMG